MKKIIAVVFVLSLLLMPSAFAACESSQAYGDSENCWTEVTFGPTVIGAEVSKGTVLVYDYVSGLLNTPAGSLARAGGWLVKPATVSLDNAKVAGVLQTSVDTTRLGYPVLIQTRGIGTIKVSGSITSGDALYVAVAGAASTTGAAAYLDFSKPGHVSGSTNIATALETSTANGTKLAYIKIR